MIAERDREMTAIENYVEEQNTNQVRAESLKSGNNHHKQEISRLTEELKLIKSSVVDLQVEANTMISEKNIAIYKLQKLQGEINEITAELNSTRIKKEEYEEKI